MKPYLCGRNPELTTNGMLPKAWRYVENDRIYLYKGGTRGDFGNFGVLRDNHTGEIIAPAPIIDNGLSLFCYAGKEDIPNLAEYAKTRSNPYNISFEEVCAEVMGAKQKEQLRRMIDSKFKRHPSLNLPDEHLTAIEQVLEVRVRKLLAIPIRKQ